MQAATQEREAVVAASDDTSNAEASDNLSPLTLVRLAKARHRASRDCTLYFDGAQHRFRTFNPQDRTASSTATDGKRAKRARRNE
jgi:hypothetical protein